MARTVMLIEDDPDTVEILRLYLEHEGFQPVVACDGAEALKTVKQHNPDLIILDLMLPKLGGLEVCRRIREESRVPIVVLTARLEEESRRASFEIGVDEYLFKPISPRDLMARVRSVLEGPAPPP